MELKEVGLRIIDGAERGGAEELKKVGLKIIDRRWV